MVTIVETPPSEEGAGQVAPAENKEFMELSPDQIIVEKQIRSEINTAEESFLALKASIEKVGLLEPLLVVKCDSGYRLLAGERRLRACCELGLATIPVRVLENISNEADRISIQLIENLLRKDLDPIDQANACVDFFRTRKKGITADEIIDLLITFERDPERLAKTFAETFSAMGTYTGKSYRSITNGLTLLRLPKRMQNDLKTEIVSPSIGYLFAANLDCNRSMEFYDSFLKNPTTVKALQSKFKQYWDALKVGHAATAAKKPFLRLSASIKSTRTVIEKNATTYFKADIEQLLAEVEALQTFLKEKLLTAPVGEAASPTRSPASRSSRKKASGKTVTGKTVTGKTKPKKTKLGETKASATTATRKTAGKKAPMKKPANAKKASGRAAKARR